MKSKKYIHYILLVIALFGLPLNVNGVLARNYTSLANSSQIIYILVLLLSFYVYKLKIKNENNVIGKTALSFILGGVSVYGGIIKAYNSLFFQIDFRLLVALILKFIGITFLIYLLVSILFAFLANIRITRNKKLKNSNCKNWLIYTGIMLVIWFPMFLILYPGVLGWDGMDQINQFFAARSGNLSFYLTNHHPYFTTVILGNLWKIGMITRNVNYTVAFLTIVLAIITSSCFNYLIVVVQNFYGNVVAKYLFIFLCIFPIFPFWAMTIDKTILFLDSFAIFLTQILITINSPSSFRNKSTLFLFLSSILVGLTRNDGFVYVCAAMVGLLFYSNKRKLSAVLLVSLLLIVGFNKVLLPVMKVLPSEPMESMGVPIQQIARVYTVNPSSITKKQEKTLSQFLDTKNLRNAYNASNYDSVKHLVYYPQWKLQGNYETRKRQLEKVKIVKDKKEFYRVWGQIGRNNKKIYLDSVIVSNYNYLYPVAETILIWNEPPLGQGTPSGYEYTKYFKGYQMFDTNKLKGKLFTFIINSSKLPILNLIMSCSFWVWSFLVMATYLLIKDYKKYLLIVLPLLGCVLTSLVGPINGGLRYVFPLILGVPILLILSLEKKK